MSIHVRTTRLSFVPFVITLLPLTSALLAARAEEGLALNGVMRISFPYNCYFIAFMTTIESVHHKSFVSSGIDNGSTLSVKELKYSKTSR